MGKRLPCFRQYDLHRRNLVAEEVTSRSVPKREYARTAKYLLNVHSGASSHAVTCEVCRFGRAGQKVSTENPKSLLTTVTFLSRGVSLRQVPLE